MNRKYNTSLIRDGFSFPDGTVSTPGMCLKSNQRTGLFLGDDGHLHVAVNGQDVCTMTDTVCHVQGNVIATHINENGIDLVTSPQQPTITNITVSNDAWTPIDDTAVLANSSTTNIIVDGTNFTPGSVVMVQNKVAKETNYISPTQLYVRPPSLPRGSYNVKVLRPDLEEVVVPSGLTYSETVTWGIMSGLLFADYGIAFDFSLIASSDSQITYSNATPLPPETLLDTATGSLSGTITTVTQDTTYSLQMIATDEELQKASKFFIFQYTAMTVESVDITDSGWTPTGGTVLYQSGGYIVVNGGGFIATDVVQIDGIDQLTTFISPSKLGAIASGNTAGSYDIGVKRTPTIVETLVDAITYEFIISVSLFGVGFDISYALTIDGASPGLYGFGNNAYGQLGNGGTTQVYTKVLISGALAGKTLSSVVSKYNTTYALANGAVYAWGRNNTSQLGDGTIADKYSPTLINGGSLSGKTITRIACSGDGPSGGGCAFAIDTNGTLYGWGQNISGKLGDGTSTTRSTPVVISGGDLSGKVIVDVSSGDYGHTLAVSSTGNVYSWGYNGFGQLGLNSTSGQTLPVAVTAGGIDTKTIVKVATGNHHSFALANDGTLFGWGMDGNYGRDNGEDQTIPFNISTIGSLVGKSVSDISSAIYTSCAVTTDGAVHNITSTITDITTGSMTGRSASSVICGKNHILVKDTLGLLHGRGSNSYFQLADSDLNSKSVFTIVNL
jgi:alpha-tubulin suppressor-like RCC1 family protein